MIHMVSYLLIMIINLIKLSVLSYHILELIIILSMI